MLATADSSVRVGLDIITEARMLYTLAVFTLSTFSIAGLFALAKIERA